MNCGPLGVVLLVGGVLATAAFAFAAIHGHEILQQGRVLGRVRNARDTNQNGFRYSQQSQTVQVEVVTNGMNQWESYEHMDAPLMLGPSLNSFATARG